MQKLFFLLASCVLTACGGSLVQRVDELPPAPVGEAFLQLRCSVPDAEIMIDGGFKGQLDGYIDGVLKLPQGRHRLTVSAKGYYPHHQVIELSDQPLLLEIALAQEVPLQEPTGESP